MGLVKGVPTVASSRRYVFNPGLRGGLRYVHPIQVKGLIHLLREPLPEQIDLLYIFGSSLDLSCGATSDIDLYAISEHDRDEVYKQLYTRCRGMGRTFDILVSNRADFDAEAIIYGTVESVVDREGLCLYAKP
jgi:hypothetical protein